MRPYLFTSLIFFSMTAQATLPTLARQEAQAGVVSLSERQHKISEFNSGALVLTSSLQPGYIFTLRRNVNHRQSSWQVEASPISNNPSSSWIWESRWGMERGSENAPVLHEYGISKHIFGIEQDLDFVWNGLIPSVGTDAYPEDPPQSIPFRFLKVPHTSISFGHWTYHKQLSQTMPTQIVFKNNHWRSQSPVIINLIVSELANHNKMKEGWPLLNLQKTKH